MVRYWLFYLVITLPLLFGCGVSPSVLPGTQGAVTHRSILNGITSSATEFPEVLKILIDNGPGKPNGVCTGTLVSPRIVLTAAHCVMGRPMKIVTNPANPAVLTSQDYRVVTGVQVHEAYSSVWARLWDGIPAAYAPAYVAAPDLALLYVDAPIPSSIARLYPGTFDAPSRTWKFPLGGTAEIVGYGMNERESAGIGVRRHGVMRLAGFLPTLNGNGTFHRFTGGLFSIPDTGNQNTCPGDSGGPLLVERMVAGVLSGGEYQPSSSDTPRCVDSLNSTHTSVYEYLDWIAPRVAAYDAAWLWTNPRNFLDVNADGVLTAFDALLVINRLNLKPLSFDIRGLPSEGFLDVTGDGRMTAFDALTVINALNLYPVGTRIRNATLAGVTTSAETVDVRPSEISRGGTTAEAAFDRLYATTAKRLGLRASRTVKPNTLRLKEKWLEGTGGQLYYWLPNGNLVRAGKTPTQAGTLIAAFPTRLYSAFR